MLVVHCGQDDGREHDPSMAVSGTEMVCTNTTPSKPRRLLRCICRRPSGCKMSCRQPSAPKSKRRSNINAHRGVCCREGARGRSIDEHLTAEGSHAATAPVWRPWWMNLGLSRLQHDDTASQPAFPDFFPSAASPRLGVARHHLSVLLELGRERERGASGPMIQNPFIITAASWLGSRPCFSWAWRLSA